VAARVGSLSTPDRLRFQEDNWRAGRIGWAALAALVAAALLGLFGDGALSNAESASSDGSLTVGYRRLLRAESPAQLDVTAAPSLADGGRLAIRLDAAYLARFETVTIEPEPESTALGNDRTTFYFATTATRPVTVRFRLEARRAGSASGAVEAGAARVELRQFVYP